MEKPMWIKKLGVVLVTVVESDSPVLSVLMLISYSEPSAALVHVFEGRGGEIPRSLYGVSGLTYIY